VVEIYHQFLDAVRDAARRGSTAEDLTSGHSLMADPAARLLQFQFADFAGAHLQLLQDVLRDSSDEDQRAMAATIIGYAPDKKDVVNDLENAMQDPDEAVRSNALRALNAIAVLARLEPRLGIHVSPTWFVEMLNSIVLERPHARRQRAGHADRAGRRRARPDPRAGARFRGGDGPMEEPALRAARRLSWLGGWPA
jgi:hypothetical protein